MSQRNIANIARSEAMAQFSSTEQLDQRLVVVRGASWLLLVLAAAFIGLALTWGFLGRVPRTIEGEGIIVPQDTRPVEVMSASASGGVVELIVPEFVSIVAPLSIRRPDSVPSPFATIMLNSVPLLATRPVARLLAVISVVAFPSTI